MKAYLMYRARDFDPEQKLPWNVQALTQDLELNTLFDAMASNDGFLRSVARTAVLSSPQEDLGTILYRQAVVKDCLQHAPVIRELYQIAVDAIEGEKKAYFFTYFNKYPSSILDRSIEVLRMFVGMLKRLRAVAETYAGQFKSEGFTRLFAMLGDELSDAYFAAVENHLKQLKLRDGVLVSAELGKGLKGANYTLRKPALRQNWLTQVLSSNPPAYTVRVPYRDDNAAKAVSELRDRGLNLVANALAQSTDHVLSFFTMLRAELAFYVGCLNLHDRLTGIGHTLCFPLPIASPERKHSAEGLYDACLALILGRKVVSSDLHADAKRLVIITGANQGGKSTFLRAVGLAQLMMQCGMCVPAESFTANVCDGFFTHFRREEDATMKSGKLDEELGRMSEIVDHLTPNALLLFNESFAATNEREGSEIAGQISRALVEKGIKVLFVTHLYTFAHGIATENTAGALFLKPERLDDGARTFRIVEGEPSETSFGKDLYAAIFADA